MLNNESHRPRIRPNHGSIDGFAKPPKNIEQATEKELTTIVSEPAIEEEAITHSSARGESSINVQESMLNTTLPNNMLSKTQPLNMPNTKKTKSRFMLFRILGHIFGRMKDWSWKKRIFSTAALILIIIVAAVGWDAWQLAHKVNHLAVGNLTGSVGGSENILVAGSTNRCNLKVQNAQWGFCSAGVTGVNSDVIFIIHVVPKTKTMSVLSIPRDTFVPNARSGNESFKIDAALYQGPTQLVTAIQEDFGIPIQHYAEVGFDGFVNIVNAVGGIKMDFPEPVYDSESYLNIKTPGCKELDGVEALQVIRARHLQYDPPTLHTTDVNYWPQEATSDIARIARTHEFLRVLGATVAQKGLSNPVTDQKLIDAIAPQIQVDKGLSTSALIQLAQEFHSVNINNVPQYTLPISTTAFGSYNYGGTNYGDVVFPAESNDQKVINDFLGSSNSTDTMTGKALPSANAVNVNVVNGSGIPEQASAVTSSLQSLGFNMVGEPGSATPLSPEAVETVVYYAGPNTEAEAETVARQLTGPVILSQNAKMVTSGSQVTVLSGTGLAVNAAATSSSSKASSVSSSGASSTSTAAAGLEPASSATQALSPWDPIACATGQKAAAY